MLKRTTSFLLAFILILTTLIPVYGDVPREDTPDYRVSYYASACFNMINEDGMRCGYGYDMMQQLANYMQCTFSYVGYDKTPDECVKMLEKGELDIYTAARQTTEREEKFAFSKHPAITSITCMNVKAGNKKVVAGDYSTYEGLRIGLLARHTYNESFIEFTKEKGFKCEIVYYSTPTELSAALISGEVDALVNSYNRIPDDERIIENFGETPYYFMVRKEDQKIVDAIDAAIDRMNIEDPNWRNRLFELYYGSQSTNSLLSESEEEYLKKLQEKRTVITAVMKPDNAPYSWFDKESGQGIIADIFAETAKELGLECSIIRAETNEEYEKILAQGTADICLDVDSLYDDQKEYKYKITAPYLTTTISALKKRGMTGRTERIGILKDSPSIRKAVEEVWPGADITEYETLDSCIKGIIDGRVDCALLMSYAAQKAAVADTQNRLIVDIVPGHTVDFRMGVNSKTDHNFLTLWEKTLSVVVTNKSAEIVNYYLEQTSEITLIAYLFDHPGYMIAIVLLVSVLVMIIVLYIETARAKNRQLKISRELSVALEETKKANDAKLNFFSKMSHDIRTPLNVVLGMTQVAKKFRGDQERLSDALDNITTEGNYLLSMINSILDVNQLENGSIELINKPFRPYECMLDSINVLKPLAEKKNQTINITADVKDDIVVGDAGHFSQIMINIVSNAIKYTGAGGSIQISLMASADELYRFTCEDNGIGMSEEFLKHICEDYARAEDSRISQTEGTGLGMSVVRGFTELMNGKLDVVSELGKGSVFTVELPFREATDEEKKLVISSEGSEEQSYESFKGKKVLLAEDNALNAEIAIVLLQGMGLSVDVAENGQLAVEKLKESRPNEYFAIFMDMQMPVMNGIEATKAIRALERPDNCIPIIAMTANTLTSDRQSCREAGMNGYISKPVDVKNIADSLREACR